MSQVTRVVKLPPAGREALRRRLESGSFEFRSVPHALFSVKGEGVVATLYSSGKLVVQGSQPDLFLARFVEGGVAQPARSPSREEREAGDEVARVEVTTIGSDETGKGDYFGPLVVAAVRVEPEQAEGLVRAGVTDSKKISDVLALQLGAAIRTGLPHAVEVLEGEAYNAEHARVRNLNPILAELHARAIARLVEPGVRVVVDRFADESLVRRALGREDVDLVQVPRAERNPAVAAASILARAEFLVRLRELGEEHGLTLPKGAGPPVDRAGRQFLARHGREALGRVAKLHFKNTWKIGAGPP